MGFRAHGEVFFVVYDSKITAMNAPGGMVYRYTAHKTDSVVRAAKLFAPKRTGHLAGSIRRDVRQTSRDRVVGRVRATAAYSTYVHEGTMFADISAKGTRSDNMMRLRPGNGYPSLLKHRVKGQQPNPFLTRALATGMYASYPSPLGPANPYI